MAAGLTALAWLTGVAGCGTSSPHPGSAVADAARETGGLGPADGRPPASLESPAADAATPEVAEVPEAATAAYLRALDAMAAADWLTAERDLAGLAAQYPSFAGPLVNLAIVYRQQGREDAAADALARALAIEPNHPAANNELGVLARERGDFAAAEAAYRRALAGDPDYGLAHYNLGVLLDVYLARRDEALTEYEAYQRLSPGADPDVEYWVVDLRRQLGRPSDPARLAQEDGE